MWKCIILNLIQCFRENKCVPQCFPLICNTVNKQEGAKNCYLMTVSLMLVATEWPQLLLVMSSGSRRDWWPTFIPDPGPQAQLSWSAAPLAAWEAASSTWRSRSFYPGCWGRELLRSCCVTGWRFGGARWSADLTETDLPRWGFLGPVNRLVICNVQPVHGKTSRFFPDSTRTFYLALVTTAPIFLKIGVLSKPNRFSFKKLCW